MSFASPAWLVLLIVLPLTWYVGWPRYSFRRRRDTLSLILRSTILLLLVLALAGLQVIQQVDRLAVAFLVDASDSIGTDLRADQLAYIQEAVAEKPPDDEWALIVFGADVSIDTPFIDVSEVPPVRSTVLGSDTNLAEALQTAISLFPADARRRVVVLSDGIQTIGNAEAKARLAEASGVEISYVLFAREQSADVRIAQFTSPARVNEGQEFDISVVVEADEPTAAILEFYDNNRLIREEAVTLRAGTNNFSLTQRSGATGFLNFSAQVVVSGDVDSYTQNNRLGTFSQVVGQPRVLLISDDRADSQNLEAALTGAGLQVDVVDPAALPADTVSLAVYQSVIVADVPATALSLQQQRRIQSYVRDLGGGLVVVGGPESYGPGGYFQSPLEEALPVETQIRDQQRLPRLTIAYLVDSSGSMGVSSDGVFTNLELAQRAVILSIAFLQPTDRAAVLTFESDGALVAPFQNVDDRRALQDRITSLGTGGGTDILAGVRTAERYIVDEPTERKHLILITDGGASPMGLVETAERLNVENGVTMSVIAIGTTQPNFLREMAEVGGGNYHAVANVGQIPSILAQETVLATRSYIEEGDIAPRPTANNPILDGLSQPPNLRGYVATSARQTAQVVLRGPQPFEDPLLATWQYGLGRTVAFTSDATGRWAADWLNWGDFSRFWGQVVNYSITENAGNNIETRVQMGDTQAEVTVDARSQDGTFLNNLVLQASVVAPDGSAETISLQQIAPGQYRAQFTPSDEGAYFLAINGGGEVDGQAAQFNEITGWVMSYSAEYEQTTPNERLLDTLATITGGSDIAALPGDAFITTQEPRTAAAPVWPWLLLVALVIFPFDIAIRRIVVTQRDWQRFRAWLSGSDPDAPDDERLSSLFSARERARERTQMGQQDTSAVSALRRARERTPRSEGESAPDQAPPAAVPRPRRPPITPEKARPSVGSGSTVGDLLKRRRSDEDAVDDEA